MHRRHFIKNSAMGAMAAAVPASAIAQSDHGDAALITLFDEIFNQRVALSPESLTSLGLDKGERAQARFQLDDRSEAQEHKSDMLNLQALQKLRAVDPAHLSPTRAKQREVAIWYLNRRATSARWKMGSVQHPYVLSQRDGAYFQLPDFLDSRHTIANAQDAESYLARLDQMGHALDQDSERQLNMVTRKLVAPGWALDMTLKQLRALRNLAPEKSGMAQSLARRASQKGLAGDWEARAAAIIAAKIYPALDRQIALVEKLRQTTPAGDGMWRVQDGDGIYADALAEATTTSFTPDEVHKIGLGQVAELSARLDKVLAQAGLTQGKVGERLAALNQRPDQLYPNTDEGRAALLASLNAGVEDMKRFLPKAFNDIPNDPLEIRRVPVEIQDGAPNGYYYRAPLDGSRPAIYWINLRDTADWPKYGLPDLTYHEGLPGHHLQLSYLRHAGDLPRLLQTLGNSAYTEGWALYAEQLAAELGALPGLYEAGYLQSLLFRATRLVVDTGIHAKRWSREKATAYMVETTGFPQGRAQSEIERYIAMVGQACSYKIGHNMWVRLRAKAEAELGSRFSLGWFHEVLKDGILPLALLEQRVEERIKAAKA